MLAARRRDRCAATGADGVTAPTIGVALSGSNTMAAAVTAAIAPSVPAGSGPTTASSASSAATAAPSAATAAATAAPAAPAFSERRTYGQGNHAESEHEHTKTRHVACLPGASIATRGSSAPNATNCVTDGTHGPCQSSGHSKNASRLPFASG